MSPPNFSLEDLRRQEAKLLAQTRLASFAHYMLEVSPALHHKIICNAMDELLNDDYDELIILAPPGSAKSTYTSIALPSYFMGRFPKGHVLTASYSAELAEKWGRRVRNLVDTPKFNQLFEVGLSKDSMAASRWANNQGGEFYAAGVGGGILGFRADLAIIDDPISGFEQAQSLTQLQKVHAWYETDFVTRLKPKAKSVLICQRLARNDLAGYLIDRNQENPTRRQRILKLPMIAQEDDPLGRNPGDRLWPDWFTPEMVADAQRDEYKWKTLYQQEPPSDDGSWVTPDEIKIVDIVPQADRLKHYLLSDLALSVNSGDYSVHITVGVDDDLNVYVLDAWRGRTSIEVTAEKHLTLSHDYLPSESLIDDDNAAKVYVQLLSQMARAAQINVPWKMLPMRGQDKETRAAPLRGWFKRGKIFLKRGDWNRWLTKELLTFPNAIGEGVDDGVDALGLIGRRLGSLSRAAPATPVGPPPDSRGSFFSATFDQLWETLPKSNRRI